MKNSPFKITVFSITVAVSIIFVSSCSKAGNDIYDDSIRDQLEASDVSEYTTDNSEVELPKIPFDSTSTTGEISQPETTVPPETTPVTAETTVPAETTTVNSEVYLPKIPF